MGVTVGKLVVAIWLVSLPLATACRIPAWRSDQTLWGAAMTVAPQTRRVLGRSGAWGEILIRDEAERLRQPFGRRARPDEQRLLTRRQQEKGT
mgnify:CR=1 FL=1